MTVTVTSALAGPATARYSNIYGALVDLGVLSGLGAQDVTGSGDPVAPILNASEFYAPLTHSLILTRGTGDPTYSRATNAWEFDNEGKLITVPSGAARFGGARMVRNLWAYSETPTNAYWEVLGGAVKTTGETDPFGGTNAAKITINAGRFDNATAMSIPAYSTVTMSYWAKANAVGNVGCGYAGFTPAPSIAVTTDWQRVQTTFTVGSSSITFVYPVHVTGTDAGITDVWLYGIQVEIVTGQADQTASEYVSAGVLSAPYHGAGVDGVKYFNTNKDGSSIAASSLLGYHAEGARTNNLLYSRDLTKFNYWITTGTGSEKCGNGTFDDATGWTLDAGYSVSGGVLGYSAAGGTSYASYGAIDDYTVGKTYLIEFDYVYTSGNGPAFYIRGGTASFSATTTSGHKQLIITCGTSVVTALRVAMFSAGVWTIDNLTIKEAAIQVTTATGLDNAANSASTLTAGAADATILQTLTMAAAARSFSAYVKRRTGSGNVYITRDGGTSWTDITSSLGASWTRVKIENTSVLNPSVGFKIATSGDAIDVDVCQDEAGAFVSSPIVTTTAAVTRNSDLLTYPKASNLSDAAGTGLISWRPYYESTGNFMSDHLALIVDVNGRMCYGTNGQAQTNARAYDGTNILNSTCSTRANGTHRKQATAWGANFRTISEGAASVSSGNYDGSMGAGSTIQFGDSNGSHYVKGAYIWSTALTDAQLQQVTT